MSSIVLEGCALSRGWWTVKSKATSGASLTLTVTVATCDVL